jgi:hypothetical protein
MVLAVAFGDQALGELGQLRRILQIIGRIGKAVKIGTYGNVLDARNVDEMVQRSENKVHAPLPLVWDQPEIIKITPMTPPLAAISLASWSGRLYGLELNA